MRELLRRIAALPEAAETIEAIGEGRSPVALTGLAPVHRATLAAALRQALGRPLTVICSDESEAERMAADLSVLTGETPLKLYSRELYVPQGAVTSREWEYRRIEALYRLDRGEGSVLVATAEGLLQRTGEASALRESAIPLSIGAQVDLTALPERLVAAGYTRTEQVEGVGQFALRGGILDVFSPRMEQAVRCDFFDDEIDAMGEFDLTTQRRIRNIDAALLLPARELIGARTACAFDFLPKDTLLVLCESGRVAERVKGALFQTKEDTEALLERGESVDLTALLLSQREWEAALSDFPLCVMESLPTSRYILPPKVLLSVSAKQLSSYGGSLDTAAGDMEHYLTTGSGVLLLCGNETRAKNLQRILQEREIPAALDFQGTSMPATGEVRIALGSLSAGAEWPQLKLAVLTEGQLTAPVSGKKGRNKTHRGDSNRKKIQSYTDLTPGDLVVHTHHGIGRFVGMQRMPVDGVEKDYIKIAYAGSDCLYVPEIGRASCRERV